MELIQAEDGEYLSCEVDGVKYTDKYDFIKNNCCEAWNWASEHPERLYQEHILTLAWSYQQACLEFVGMAENTTEYEIQPREITKTEMKKVHFAHLDTDVAGAPSPSKLPTPSSTTHSVDSLRINTDINISDDEIDDGDIDCGDFSEMASRQVAQELHMLKNQRFGLQIKSHI